VRGPTGVLVRGGTVLDATGSRRADVAVAGTRVVGVGPDLAAPAGWVVLDAGGCVVAPGLVDLHTHLRQPGREEAETVETGARAAALGGFTAVVAMPNTEPAIDGAEVVREVQELARGACCHVAVAGAITRGRDGEALAPMAEMAELGVRLFTDDGRGVQDPGLMRRALEYSSALGVGLAQHCEDEALAAGGAMHEGAWSARLGVPGVPAEAEEVMVRRDLALARRTAPLGARLHLQHLSTAGALAALRQARAEGLAVTAEATPHHLALTDAELAGYDPVYKVNPPLRPEADRQALVAAVADGTVDAIATDHAPHPPEAKELALDEAPPGVVGLETALPVALQALGADIGAILALMSWRPARIAGLEATQGGPVAEGRPANLCVVDLAAPWVLDPARLASRSRNTPFAGRRFEARVRHTLVAGEPVVVDAEARR